MLAIGIAFMSATWCAFLFDHRLSLLLSAACGLTGLLLMQVKKPDVRVVSLVCFSAAVAFAAYSLRYARTVLPVAALEGQVRMAEGIITRAELRGGAVDYTLQASFPEEPGLPRNMLIAVRTFGEMESVPGDTVRARVQLYLPRSGSAEAYYRARGVSVLGYALADEIRGIPTGPYRPQRFFIRLRRMLQDNLYEKLPDRSASVVSAMVLGLQDEIEPAVYSAVNRAGTAHLLSVSGLHLSVLTAIFLRLWQRLRLPERAGNLFCILMSFLFAALVGFSAPIVRAFVMTAVMLLARLVSRRADSLSALGLSLLLICLTRPYWVLGRGLWLSAGSTLGILLFGGRRADVLFERVRTGRPVLDRAGRAFLSAAVISVSAYLVTLPVLLLSSGWISLLSPLANMLITPFVPVVMLGGIVCAALPGSALPLQGAAFATDFCTRMILHISQLFAALPFSTLSLDEGWMVLLFPGVAAGACVVFFAREKQGLVRFALLLCVLSFSAGGISMRFAARDSVELAALSGCDAAVMLRGRDAVVLGTPSRYELSRLLRYLDFRGVRRIRAVIAADCPDQIGSGLLRLRDEYGIDCLIGPDDVYILGQLELALPETMVYSGGYADIELLGGAEVTLDLLSSNIKIRFGEDTVLKKDEEYVILGKYTGNELFLYRDGAAVWPESIPPLFEPVGGLLFGETRFLLGPG